MNRKQTKSSRELSIRPVSFKFTDRTLGDQTNAIQDPLDVPPIGMFAPTPDELHNDENLLVSDTGEQKRNRRMHTDEMPTQDTPILIMDSAADISCVGKDFEILFYTGETTSLGVAMAMVNSSTYEIVSAAAVVESPVSSQKYLIIINQAAYIPDSKQFESLLHTDQARYHNVVINDSSKFFRDSIGNPGKQSIEADGFEIPLQHDGSKYFLKIRRPTALDWEQLPVIELTSPTPWNENRHYNRRVKEKKTISPELLQEWSERLGHLNLEATQHTLHATTQMISSVEAETRTTPRRHLKSRLPELRPRRLNEGFHSDTFFASERSARGNTCAQVFVGELSGYTIIVPLKNKGQAHIALQDFIRFVGAPKFIVVDGAPEENRGEWLKICRTYCIPLHTTEPGYQNQNRAERRIGDIKRRAMLLMSLHGSPERYWDYATEYAVELINHTAVERLQWRTPFERIYGDTPDISIFRFIFYEPIYYLEPNASFPCPNMLAGRFLGIARTTGDAFTFYIRTDRNEGRNIVLTRSVIRKRNPLDPLEFAEYEPLIPEEEEGNESVLKNQGTDDNIPHEPGPQREIIDIGDVEMPFEPSNLPITTVLAKHIEERDPEEIIIEGGGNVTGYHIHETGDTIIHFEDGSYKEMSTEDVYNHLNHDYRCEDVEELLSLQYSNDSGKLYVMIKWKDGREYPLDAELLRKDDPMRLAHFIHQHPVERLRNGYWNEWSRSTLRNVSKKHT